MTFDMEWFWTAFSLPSITAAVVGGVIAGAGLAAVHPYPVDESVLHRLMHHSGMLLWFGLLFYVGRVSGLWADNDPTAFRPVGVFLHWVIFTAASVLGGWLVYRARED